MRAVHSLYFELLAERGIVGCLLFGLMAIHFYRGLNKLRRAATTGQLRHGSVAMEAELYGLALQASLASFLVAAAFLSMLAYPYFWFLTALGVALDRGVRGAAFEEPEGTGASEDSNPELMFRTISHDNMREMYTPEESTWQTTRERLR
jgi:O-antigen ligase